MTDAPQNLLATRTLLLTYLKPHGLAAAAVGIVGDPAHRGGYHCGRDRVVTSDYSTRVDRDRAGLCDYASALDIGTFTYGRHNLRTFSVWLVGECAKNAPDTRDIREVIYSPDGKNVRRWDREGRSTTGDDSHLWHTHISYYRDATKAGRDLRSVFRRYLTEIGLITPIEEDDLTPAQAYIQHVMNYRLAALRNNVETYRIPAFPAYGQIEAVETNQLAKTLRELGEKLNAPAPVTVTVDASAAAVLAQAVNDDAARRLTN